MSKLENPRVPTSAADAKHPFDAAELLKDPPGSVYAVHGETGKRRKITWEEEGSGFAVERTRAGGKDVCYVATNDHVTRPITSPVKHTIFVDLPEGGQGIATKVFADNKRDISLLRIEGIAEPEKNCKPWALAGKGQFIANESRIVRISQSPAPDAAAGEVLNYVSVGHKFTVYKPGSAKMPANTMIFSALKANEGNSGSPLSGGTNLAYGMTTIAGHFTIIEAHHKVTKVPMVLGTPAQFITEDLRYMHKDLTKPPKRHR